MKKNRYINGAFAVVLALLFSVNSVAQQLYEPNSPTAIELLKSGSLWFNSGNGAGVVLDQLERFSLLETHYKTVNGDFKRVQSGDRENTLTISSEGGQKIGEGYAWGKFSYENISILGSQFNTAMLNPFRAVPYYPVDPVISDWQKQNYNLEMKAATRPLWQKIVLGIQATYTASTGAKQMDPRSEVFFYSLNIKPGIAALFGDQKVGFNFEYENMVQETRRHTNSNTQLNQNVFVMRGLGNHYTAVIGGLQSLGGFHYSSNKIGGEFQYSYTLNDVEFFLNGGYTFRVEDVIRDISKPRKEGTIKDNSFYANVAILVGNHNLSRIDLSFKSDRLDGIEYVQYLDTEYEVQQWVDLYSSIRSTYNQDNINLSYNFYKVTSSNDDYRWRVGAFVNYTLSDDLYIMPYSQMKVENLYIGANGKVNVNAGSNGRFTLGANLVYKNNMDGLYSYGGADPASVVITNFFSPDFEYLRQSYYNVGGDASYYILIGKTRKNGLLFKAAVDYFKPTEGEGNRVLVNFGVGLTF